jgi:hypothetical protein
MKRMAESPSVDATTKRLLVAAAALALAAVLAVAAVRGGFLQVRPAQIAAAQKKQDRLFKEIDQTALRDACRTMIVKFGDPHLKHLELDDPRIPPIVRRLEPTEVVLVQNYLRIELGDAQFHYGLEAFRDRMSQAPFPIARELLDGLWYYEDATAEMLARYAR